MSDTKSFDFWVKGVLGVDPADYAAPDRSGASGRAGAAAPGAEPTGLFGLSGKQADPLPAEGSRADDAPTGTPTTAPVTLTLTSETEVTQPADRTRTKIGVGERVTLKLTPVGGTWKVSGPGSVKPKTGSTVVLTASGKAGKIKISVTAQGKTETIEFTVIAPSSVHQDTVDTEHYDVGVPNAGFHGQVYCGPDDVNFSNITFLEAEIGCKATGSWKKKNGKGHGPNKTPIGFEDTVVSGKGTKSLAVDHCWSGYVPGLTLTDWSGQMTFSIPWTYQCAGGKGKIATVLQTTSTSADGTTSTKKAGGSSGDYALS